MKYEVGNMKYLVLGLTLVSLVGFVTVVGTVFAQTKQTGNVAAVPTEVPHPTATPPPGHTIVFVTLFLHGIGKGGDNANVSATGTLTPVHPQRSILAEVYNDRNELLIQQEGVIVYNASAGNFKGYVDLGPGFPSGDYYLKVRTPLYLRKQLGIQAIQSNTTNNSSTVTLIVGDTSGDNKINVLDYNQIIRCYTKSRLCTPVMRENTDINDDGTVNQFDYNLFLREVWIQPGQ